MANPIEIIKLFPNGLSESLPAGTVVATISNPEGLQLTYDFRYWEDYRGISGWWDGPSTLFRVEGNQIVTTGPLDFDAFAGRPFYYQLSVMGGQSSASTTVSLRPVFAHRQAFCGHRHCLGANAGRTPKYPL